MCLQHCCSGGILLSCRAPGYRGSWPHAAPPPDADGLFPWQPHCGWLVVALLHAGRAAVLMRISPHYPGAGREVLVSLPASSIVTGDILWACLSGTSALASTWSTQDWPSPALPVSMGAGTLLERVP